MNFRSNISPIIAAAALAITAASDLHAAPLPSTTPLPHPTTETKDTVISGATRSVIETFGELSRTATRLSETALKLMQAQEEIEQKKNASSQTETYTQPRVYIGDDQPRVYIGDDQPRVYIGEDQQTGYTDYTVGTALPEKGAMVEEEEEEEEYTGPRVFISDEGDPYTTPVQSPETERAKAERMKSLWNLQPEGTEGGHYIWVPDGAQLTTSIKDNCTPDLNELTYWHGDSIPLAIPSKRFGRYDRKLYNWLIYPKGQWHISLSANYGELTTEDSEILSLLKDIDVGGKIYSIKPSVSYFFKHNICAGIRLAFTKGELAINNFKVDVDEDINFNLHDVKYSSDSYAAAIFLQQHIGLSRRGRFSVYNEVEIAYGMGSKHFIRPFDGEMKDTRTKTNSFNINYSPGVSIMIMKNAAFNLSFGIFGFHLQNEKQWENGEESGNRFTSGINFRFNIFNINFGVSIII